jgi:predicted enzyme related to lactoylglutathione lyase
VLKGKGLTVWLAGHGTSARKKLASGALRAPGGWNRIVVETADLDATLAKALAAGGRARSTIKGPGGRQVLVDDPSGNPVEVFGIEPASSAIHFLLTQVKCCH